MKDLPRVLKKISVIISMLLFIINVSGQGKFNYDLDSSKKKDPVVNKFRKLIEEIRARYVEEVDDEKLVESAIRSMLKDLDPHSIYIPKERLREKRDPLEGNFEGIGVRFNILNDTIFIINPIPGGPSEKIGIRAGDRIVKIEGENVAGIGITNSDVMDKLKGEKGTEVEVSIKREGVDKLLNFKIIRDEIPIHSVNASYMVDSKTGYIKMNRFSRTSLKEFKEAMGDLKKKGMKNLIFDLKGNGGGYLRAAINIADQFIKDDKLVVYTEGRNSPKKKYKANKEGEFEEGKLAILVDKNSASASEIVSGAVQDWDRGVIIGRRSFGKGLVQKPIRLPDGSYVRLTVSKYYTPTGRLIQKPYDDGIKEYRKEKYERLQSGELTNRDSIEFPDSLKYYTKKLKRPVFGGGGIFPDVFVPLDTTNYSTFFEKVQRKGILNTFTLKYADKHREELLSKYNEVGEFKKEFIVEKKVLPEFKQYLNNEEEVDFNKKSYKKSKKIINNRMKASIARALWDSEAFYRVVNALNEPFKRAVKVMNDGTFKKLGLAKN